MREILFRGKQGNKWVYGDLMHTSSGDMLIRKNNGVIVYGIITETVGQYTGLHDKNGNKIFEGDIFLAEEYGFKIKFVVKFGKCGGVQNTDHEVGYIGFYAIPIGKDAKLLLDSGVRTDILYWLSAYNVLVIGNISDYFEAEE